jgi:hypothetical protein
MTLALLPMALVIDPVTYYLGLYFGVPQEVAPWLLLIAYAPFFGYFVRLWFGPDEKP